MRLFDSLQVLEQSEERLRQQVNDLPNEQRKQFYQRQSQQLKDPDTYAAFNWLFLGGVHHCYLGKYLLFAIELFILMISITGIAMGYSLCYLGIAILVAYELPQLFFSQKIVRQHNNKLSHKILTDLMLNHD
ncbi:TM2 domain-containing protein [Shewanella intestini]|uniref:TM2 domain-containing protein n=1 Tax=Shewanella intestini TaxID=2017544 RepID=A0ABS5I0G5_9GAMM|nr:MULTISPECIES: hypothetical protein [Shewanella]MBR9726880.1 hypothetical protein [Shewanella intestini]MRG34554.1 hypothetical protein [Shewanella sp. XMDDZSB0408]